MSNKIWGGRVILYSVPFTKEDNYIFDDRDWLDDHSTQFIELAELTNFQFVKNSLNASIKISVDNTNVTTSLLASRANYIWLENETKPFDDVNILYDYTFYFVDSVEVIDQYTVRMNLTMDTLNTVMSLFQSSQDIPLGINTHITRMHKDRYLLSQSSVLQPIIDRFPEGIPSSKLIAERETLTDSVRGKWYMVWRSIATLGEMNDKPVKLSLVPELESEFIDGSAQGDVTISPSDISQGYSYWMVDLGDKCEFIESQTHYSFEIGVNNVYAIEFWKPFAGTFIYAKIYTTNEGSVTRSGQTITFNQCKKLYRGEYKDVIGGRDNLPTLDVNAGQTSYLAKRFSELDRTDSRIIKIVSMPYCPIVLTHGVIRPNLPIPYDKPNGWDMFDGELVISSHRLNEVSIHSEFNRNIALVKTANKVIHNFDRSIVKSEALFSNPYQEEPKLYHSDFTTFKISYDNFSYEIMAELEKDARENDAYLYEVDMITSINVSSTFLMHVHSSIDNKDSISDYDGYVAVKRNNEVPIFSSSYIDYMRNGYNYDVKNNHLQMRNQIIQSGASAAASIASLVAAPFTGGVSAAVGLGMLGNTITSVAGIGESAYRQELMMSQKRGQLMMQSASIAGSDDVDLLESYSPQFDFIVYKPNDYEQKAIARHLRLKGYATDEYGVPATHSRLHFNYVQCEPDIDIEDFPAGSAITNDILNDIKMKYREGVTYMHAGRNDSYDMKQQYENWEISLLGGLL